MAPLLLLILGVAVSSAWATCYHPDGTSADVAYQPCNTTGEFSMCCHLGVSNNNGDACGAGPTYGLCGVTGPQLWRESCTDPTWKDPACLKFCLDDVGATGDIEITTCNDGSFCCGQNNGTCCAARDGVVMVNNLPSPAYPSPFKNSGSLSTPFNPPSTSPLAVPTANDPNPSTTPISSLTSQSLVSVTSLPKSVPSTSPPVAPVAASTESSQPTPPSETGSHAQRSSAMSSPTNKLKIGLGVGGGLLVLLISFVFGWFLWKRKSSTALAVELPPPFQNAKHSHPNPFGSELDSNHRVELESSRKVELPSGYPATTGKRTGQHVYEMM